MTTQSTTSYSDIVLSKFIANNPHSKVILENGNTLIVENPWGFTDIRLKVANGDHEFIQDLNLIVFNPTFDAIFHLDSNQMEIAFGYLNPNDDTDKEFITDRKSTRLNSSHQ